MAGEMGKAVTLPLEYDDEVYSMKVIIGSLATDLEIDTGCYDYCCVSLDFIQKQPTLVKKITTVKTYDPDVVGYI